MASASDASGRIDMTPVLIQSCRTSGVRRAYVDAHYYANKAREALYHFPASRERNVLDELIDFVVERKR